MKKHLIDISKTLGATISLLTALWFFGEPFLEDYVNSRIDFRVSSPETLQKAMKSPYMMDYQMNQKKHWREEELHKDNNKAKFSSVLISKTGMNKESLGDTLAAMIKRNNLGIKYVTKSECILNSKEYARGRSQLMRN
jgi:hypothetical protein